MEAASPGAAAFSESARRVVDYLKSNTPLTDWSVSRVVDGQQIHVHVRHDERDPEQLINIGDLVFWEESFCSRMTGGAAHIVRNSLLDPDYADLEKAQDIGAYAGFPITDPDGGTFGILCGVNAAPISDDAPLDEGLISLMSDMLTTQLRLSRDLDRGTRSAALAEALANTDGLTGLLNRRGWDLVVSDTQERVNAYGDPVGVVVIDLDGLKAINDSDGHEAGDRFIKAAAAALAGAARHGDRVSRFGGDEFAVLADDIAEADLIALGSRFEKALGEAGVRASLGWASALPGTNSVAEAIARADAAMYEQKKARRAAR